ncbi:ribose-phosphate diphosphokinase [Amycolatopsis sp. NPDC049691]|uniref:ribose-phosphate diphosphokinase n=1 Tax=Amycolatopsis sp. NPDC049691 TaxID=3155155 RepID=UPI00341F6A7D
MTRRAGSVAPRLMLVSGGSHPELAERVAARLGTSITPQTAHTFANGEVFVRFARSVRGSDVFVVQTPTEPVNSWLMQSLIMVDALKRASAKRITVVWPFFPYSRQDKKHRGREPISARLVTDLLSTAGADRVMTVDLHTAQIQGFFDGPVDHLRAQPLLAEHIRSAHPGADITVVAPDSGRVRLAERWADLLGGRPIAFVQHRESLQHGRSTEIVGDVLGRHCVVVDDMIDTGATMAGAARLLRELGAAQVIATATHGILSPDSRSRLASGDIAEVVVTDTLPAPPDKRFPRLTVLSVAPLLADAIHEVFEAGSVTKLFDDPGRGEHE